MQHPFSRLIATPHLPAHPPRDRSPTTTTATTHRRPNTTSIKLEIINNDSNAGVKRRKMVDFHVVVPFVLSNWHRSRDISFYQHFFFLAPSGGGKGVGHATNPRQVASRGVLVCVCVCVCVCSSSFPPRYDDYFHQIFFFPPPGVFMAPVSLTLALRIGRQVPPASPHLPSTRYRFSEMENAAPKQHANKNKKQKEREREEIKADAGNPLDCTG